MHLYIENVFYSSVPSVLSTSTVQSQPHLDIFFIMMMPMMF